MTTSGMTAFEELRGMPLFSGLSDGELQEVVAEGDEVRVGRGEVYAREGEPVEHLHVVLEGELRISKLVDGREVVLNTYTPGIFFAEVPLLSGTPFLASGRALSDSRLFRIPNDLFRRMLSRYPAFSEAILETMAGRVQSLQTVAVERRKLDSLSTLAAGLAHELKQPRRREPPGRRRPAKLPGAPALLQRRALPPAPRPRKTRRARGADKKRNPQPSRCR